MPAQPVPVVPPVVCPPLVPPPLVCPPDVVPVFPETPPVLVLLLELLDVDDELDDDVLVPELLELDEVEEPLPPFPPEVQASLAAYWQKPS
jgi:hypothetical protein